MSGGWRRARINKKKKQFFRESESYSFFFTMEEFVGLQEICHEILEQLR
jgi:hypothetical protein